MPIEIAMPSYSESMEAADLIGWLVSPGDFVKKGDPIAEIETDKATGELESPSSGTLVEICVPEGSQGVKVGTVVARLEPAEAPATAVETPDASPPAPATAPDTQEEPTASEAAASVPKTSTEPSTPPPAAENPTPATDTAPQATSATALARRVAEQAGIDIEQLKGTGSRGRVTKTDVETAVAGGPATAGRTAASVAVLDVECDVARALDVCQQVSQRESEFEIGLIAFTIRAAGLAFSAVPEMLASSTEEHLARDILVQSANQPPKTVADTDRKSLAVISEELSREPATTIPAPLVQICDFSALGIKRVQPALIEGTVMALGVGATRERSNEAAYEAASPLQTTVNFTLCVDTARIDIGVAARWLFEFRQRLEDPLEMLL